MNREIKEKELLATQYKIERLKKESGFFKRKWIQTILFGAGVTLLGPFYTGENEITGQRRNALKTSGTSYLELALWVAIFYSVSVIIAHLVWTRREKKKLLKLQERKKIIEMELELFHKEL